MAYILNRFVCRYLRQPFSEKADSNLQRLNHGTKKTLSRIHSMNIKQILSTLITTVPLLFFMGCSYQRSVSLPPVEFPESIFSMPQGNTSYANANVAVYSFSEPTYAPGQGKIAARVLCHEMEQMRVFASVTLQPDILDMTLGNLIHVARSKGYDLVIVGNLLYFFSGSDLEPSEITEEIRVIKIRGGRPSTLWHAKATETAMPAPTKDYILARGKGAPAPTTALLMKRNAQKFCNMIMDLKNDAGSNTPDVTE